MKFIFQIALFEPEGSVVLSFSYFFQFFAPCSHLLARIIFKRGTQRNKRHAAAAIIHENASRSSNFYRGGTRSHDRKNVKQRVNASLIRNRCIAARNDRPNKGNRLKRCPGKFVGKRYCTPPRHGHADRFLRT